MEYKEFHVFERFVGELVFDVAGWSPKVVDGIVEIASTSIVDVTGEMVMTKTDMKRTDSQTTASLAVNRVVTEYAEEKANGRGNPFVREFMSGGARMKFENGTLYREGEAILRVIDTSQSPVLSLRKLGTADGSYSFTNEIPVETLNFEEPGAHERNLNCLRRQIGAILKGMNAKYDMRIAFTAVLGVRHYANDYTKHFGLPPMGLGDEESHRLGVSVLLQDDNQDVAQDVIKRYKSMYNLGGSDSLDAIGA